MAVPTTTRRRPALRNAIYFAFALLIFLAAASADRIKTTREEILASRQRRVEQLEAMLNDAKQQLQGHSSGRRLLDEDERVNLQRKVDVFSRKLESMQGELDEREVERILKREELRDQRLKERIAQRRERHRDEL